FALCMMCFCCFFFFQAEDGIRDGHVTGVQTCALPISFRARGDRGTRGGDAGARKAEKRLAREWGCGGRAGADCGNRRQHAVGGRNGGAGSRRSPAGSLKDSPSALEGSPSGSGASTGFGDSHLWRHTGKRGGSGRAIGGLRPAGGSGPPDQDPWGGGWGGVDYRAAGSPVWSASQLFGRFPSFMRVPVGGRRGDRRKIGRAHV